MQPKFCSNCGAALAAGQRFCPRCGAPVSPPTPLAREAAPPGPTRRGPWALVGAAIAIIGIALVAILLPVAPPGDGPPTPVEGTATAEPTPALAVTETPVIAPTQTPPILPIRVCGTQGVGLGQFNRPRGVAAAPDGSIYIADTGNHRIQKFDADCSFLLAWGSRSPEATWVPGATPPQRSQPAPPGTFDEPWGLAVDSKGNVYVADTWNHRVQKFTSDGQFLKQWGTFGIAGADNPAQGPGQFWGPRGIAIGPDGNVYVADTANKRVQVFTPEGQFVAAFGGGGSRNGQLDEPVGIAVADNGTIYVADTWNQRVEVFSKDRAYLRQWKVEQGWVNAAGEIQGINNKPYLAVDGQNRVYVTGPHQFRVIVYNSDGTAVTNFGSPDYFALPIGIALDKDGNIYVTDADNNEVLKFGPIQP